MSTAAEIVQSAGTLVIAHRGASDRAPENTLPAFAAALALGVDVVELDYRHSADGVPVVFHDELLDKTTDACQRWGDRHHPIVDEPLADLAQLDAGSWFDPSFAGTRIPTLEQAVRLVCPKAILAIERKAGDAGTLLRLMHAQNALDRVVVMAFDWEFLAECKRSAPALVTVALGDEEFGDESLSRAASIGAAVVGWDKRLLGPDSRLLAADAVAAAHRHGLRLWAWTVDDRREMRTLFAASIDGLITNRADLALEAREQARGQGPAARDQEI